MKTPKSKPLPAPAQGVPKNAPTRQQGQFLAFIREYMQRNYHGVAPTHAALQKFFNLTAPSVNSMLIRLEKRGFIRRIPREARAIELTIDPGLIPPLERPFKFWRCPAAAPCSTRRAGGGGAGRVLSATS